MYEKVWKNKNKNLMYCTTDRKDSETSKSPFFGHLFFVTMKRRLQVDPGPLVILCTSVHKCTTKASESPRRLQQVLSFCLSCVAKTQLNH